MKEDANLEKKIEDNTEIKNEDNILPKNEENLEIKVFFRSIMGSKEK